MIRILVLSGSARLDSVHRKLARLAVEIGAEMGADCEFLDPRDYVLPLYDGDLEASEGLPQAALQLKAKFADAQGLLFCSPEYNSSVTPLMKNLIDWISRPATDDEPSLSAYRGKVAGLLGASPGALGGLRGLVHLRSILGNLGVHVIPGQFALGGAYGKFDGDGRLTDDDARKRIAGVIQELVHTTSKLAG